MPPDPRKSLEDMRRAAAFLLRMTAGRTLLRRAEDVEDAVQAA